MTNKDILDQLRFRREKISRLQLLQKNSLAIELCKAELYYVNSLIEYRERYGGLDEIILEESSS